MQFRTEVDTGKAPFAIEPQHELMFIGSCFADNIGQRFIDNSFRTVKNPYGVMYNPVSILHSVEKWLQGIPATKTDAAKADGAKTDEAKTDEAKTAVAKTQNPDIVFLTLGTNHVYRLKETGEIVDNCQKRPQRLFNEEELTVEQCAEALQKAIDILRTANNDVRIVITVSPIRYAKYGFHKSQLSKATLLLAADKIESTNDNVCYFPAYEIVNDELRDYRFYTADMLHPSQQAVDYIWERLSETFFGERSKQFIAEWLPIRDALNHKPFNPESEQYLNFIVSTRKKLEAFKNKYNLH